jgi:thiol:disulfide interchange protein
MQFVGGAVMLVVGLFILSQKVMVSSGWFGYGFSLGGVHLSSGLIMVPFIIGIVWMFMTNASFPSKVFTVLSVIIIITAIIMNTNIHLVTISMYEWVLILVLIFGGAGLLGKTLFSDAFKENDKNSTASGKNDTSKTVSDIESELEQMKKNMK